MSKQDFCSPANYSVLIPYRDLERFALMADKMDEMSKAVKRMEERNAAMNLMYSEMLEKIAEIKQLL